MAFKARWLAEQVQNEFHNTFSGQFHRYLDQGHGACLLKNSRCGQIVAQSLTDFDGRRYYLGDFVVMPNHVHVLFQPFDGFSAKKQCYSWKKYTSGKINLETGKRGRFWQSESYDRIVRDHQEFGHYQRYIAQNPKKASLREREYFHYESM